MTKQEVAQEVDQFLSQFDGSKVHVILNFVNTTETFDFSVRLLHRTGILILVGLHGGLGELQLPMTVLSMHTISGVYTGSYSELSELIQLVSKHSIPNPPLIMYKLEDANKAMSDLDKGLILSRAILEP